MNPDTLGRLSEYYRTYVIFHDLVNRIWCECFDPNIINKKYVCIQRVKEDLMAECREYDEEISNSPFDPQHEIFKYYYGTCKKDIRSTCPVPAEDYESTKNMITDTAWFLQRILVLNSPHSSWKMYGGIKKILYEHFMKYHLGLTQRPDLDF